MRRIVLLSLLLLPAAPGQTPNYSTNITLANLLGGGAAIASASVCATAADAHGNPLSFSAPTWGVMLRNHPFCGIVSGGTLTTPLRVPDACHTNNPTPITYNLVIQPLDGNGNPQGVAISIPALPNVCGSSYALDTYAPVASAPLPPSPAIGQGVGVPSTCTSPSIWIETGGPATYVCKNGVYAPIGTGAATVGLGAVQTLPAGSQASVTNSGTSIAAILNFMIPQGMPGQSGTNGTNGSPGQAASVAVGTVTALGAGVPPTVINTGTSTAAVLNFGFPTGGSGITAAQALTAAADGSIPASQTPIGTAVDVVAASDKTPGGNVITVGPSVGAHTTVLPLFAGSVIHDSVPGYEGHRYLNPPSQQKMHDLGIYDGNSAQWNHVTLSAQPSSYFGQQMLTTETLDSYGPGSNYSSAWRTVQIKALQARIANRGIGGAVTINYNKQATGDSNVLNIYSYFDAGWNTQSDEGMTGVRNYVSQNGTYWHGTTTSSGTGLTLPILSDATSGQNHTTDGTILLDISKGTISGTVAGGVAPLAGSAYLNAYPTSLTNLPLTTAWGICNVNFPLPSQATPQTNTPFTCTATLKLGTFTAGGLVWVAGPNYPEQAPIIAVGPVSGGTQSITVSVRNPQPDGATKGVAIFQGGLLGQYASWDANLAQPSAMRSAQYAFGSLDGVNLVTAFYGHGVTIPQPGCNAQAFCPGVAGRSGFHLYPGAEIVANLSLAHTPQLEPNAIVFVAGDLLEDPQSPAIYMTGYKGLCQMTTPPNGSGSVCISNVVGGQGAVANFYPYYTVNLNDPGMYAANGGIYDGMIMHRITGYFDYGQTFDIMPGRGLVNISSMNYHQFFGDGITTGSTSGRLFALPSGDIWWDDLVQQLRVPTMYADYFLGQSSAPTVGSACPRAGVHIPSQDGRMSWCIGGVWAQTYALASSLSAVATSGSYSDLANKPTIPTIPNASNLLLGGAGGAADSGIPVADVARLSGASNTFTGAIVAKGGIFGDPAKNASLSYQAGTGGDATCTLSTTGSAKDCFFVAAGVAERSVNGGAFYVPIDTVAGADVTVAGHTATITPAASSLTGAALPASITSAPGLAATPVLATTLRQASAARNLLMGTSVLASEGTYDPLASDATYGALLAGQYGMVEPENAGKWITVHPAQSTYNFAPSDEIVSFATAHQMKVRGHNLMWEVYNPAWLNTYASSATQAQMFATLQSHIATVVGHNAGGIFAWDVANEMLSDSQTGTGVVWKSGVWYDSPGIGGSAGPGFLEPAFAAAHAADPTALLCYNDYGIEYPGPKFNALMAMLTQMIADGSPIGCVGFQTHADLSGQITGAGLAANMAQVAALGLKVQITELDIRIPVNGSGVATAANLAAQAQLYSDIATACIRQPACTVLNVWGADDNYSWIPANFSGYGAALPFDATGKPKAAFTSVASVLQARGVATDSGLLPLVQVNSYSPTNADGVVYTNAGTVTLTALPKGKILYLFNTGSASATITGQANGFLNPVLGAQQGILLATDGANDWYPLAAYVTPSTPYFNYSGGTYTMPVQPAGAAPFILGFNGTGVTLSASPAGSQIVVINVGTSSIALSGGFGSGNGTVIPAGGTATLVTQGGNGWYVTATH